MTERTLNSPVGPWEGVPIGRRSSNRKESAACDKCRAAFMKVHRALKVTELRAAAAESAWHQAWWERAGGLETSRSITWHRCEGLIGCVIRVFHESEWSLWHNEMRCHLVDSLNDT